MERPPRSLGGQPRFPHGVGFPSPPGSPTGGHATFFPAYLPSKIPLSASAPRLSGVDATLPSKRLLRKKKGAKGGADDEAYMMTGPPVKRDPMKDVVEAAKKQVSTVRATRDLQRDFLLAEISSTRLRWHHTWKILLTQND